MPRAFSNIAGGADREETYSDATSVSSHFVAPVSNATLAGLVLPRPSVHPNGSVIFVNPTK